MSINNIIAFINICVTILNDTHFKTEGVFGYYVKSTRSFILSLMDENSEVRDAP